jgi:hypothetical protein
MMKDSKKTNVEMGDTEWTEDEEHAKEVSEIEKKNIAGKPETLLFRNRRTERYLQNS